MTSFLAKGFSILSEFAKCAAKQGAEEYRRHLKRKHQRNTAIYHAQHYRNFDTSVFNGLKKLPYNQ